MGERRRTRRCARFYFMNALGRLRWRTRRGTRELDALFGGWLDERFASANEAQQQAFDELLDVQDPDLWDWVMGHSRPERADWQAIIDDIRARHRL
jgi:antitoxin CptB